MTSRAIADLTDSYARWRSSRLGQITDILEHQLLFELLGPVTGKTILDVGCGDGELASTLARRGAIVTGLDAGPGDGCRSPTAMRAVTQGLTELIRSQIEPRPIWPRPGKSS